MVAPAGAGPWPQITSTLPLPLRASCTITGTSPPGPLRCGSTTCSVNAVATAASKALPPRSRMLMPTAVAIQCVEATAPNVPSISGRVVKGFGLMLPAILGLTRLGWAAPNHSLRWGETRPDDWASLAAHIVRGRGYAMLRARHPTPMGRAVVFAHERTIRYNRVAGREIMEFGICGKRSPL